jgi:cation transport regulator ChaC
MFVFAYGSLASVAADAEPLAVATLESWRRTWNVAMDNLESVPGYKYYLDPVTGERPALHVAFANLEWAPGVDCVGFLLPVLHPSVLAALDRRERNYTRLEVTDQVYREPDDERPTSRVWVYMGTMAARQRFSTAASAGTAVLQRAYVDGIEQAFAARGLTDRYRASTRDPECPVAELTRFNES